MATDYDLIYLSPHLDDAVLSCGGQIGRHATAGRKVLVLTVMAGDPPDDDFSPFALGQHEQWQLKNEVVARRRAEDAAACALLGADYLHWEIPDCIYRRDPQSGRTFYNSDEDLFGPVHPGEEVLVDALSSRLATLPAAEQVVAPLTVGDHVDHQLTRLAAERLWADDLLYYEDYPYVRQAEALAMHVQPAGVWTPFSISLADADLRRKIAAIAAYRSQIGVFFKDAADLERQIAAYAQRVGGERLWKKTGQADGEC